MLIQLLLFCTFGLNQAGIQSGKLNTIEVEFDNERQICFKKSMYISENDNGEWALFNC